MPLLELGQGSTASPVTQPRLPCLSLHTCQVVAALMTAKEKSTPQLSKQATLPQLPQEPCGNSLGQQGGVKAMTSPSNERP